MARVEARIAAPKYNIPRQIVEKKQGFQRLRPLSKASVTCENDEAVLEPGWFC